jgi:acryloyl-coenzyme A reductase
MMQSATNSLPTMQAFPLKRFGGTDVLVMTTVELPTPGYGQVLVRVAACGVCGQDVMRRRGLVDQVLGAIMGHEIAGTVAAVGPGVSELSVGDRVASMQRHACHRCDACLRGEEVLCATGVLYGEELDGGYAEYFVADELSLAVIPEKVTFQEAAVAACGIGTGLHALRLADVRAGQRVLVTGAGGGVGIHALQLARGMGAEVVAVTSTPGKADKLSRYADDVIVLADGHFDRQIRQRRIQPDVVIDLTARMTLPDSLRAVQRGGTVVIVGNLENGPVEVLPGAFIIREIHLIGSKACSRLELQDCLRFIERGIVKVELHGTMPLSEAAAAHKLLESKAVHGRIVLQP